MYRVQSITGERWEIVDSNDRTVFVGTKSQAEDWLDFQENARRLTQQRPWFRTLLSSLRRFACRVTGGCQAGARRGYLSESSEKSHLVS
jgi:hypothetical protein